MIKNKNIYRKEETLMAQLWGGRLHKRNRSVSLHFNASIPLTRNFINKTSAEVLHMLRCLQVLVY